MRLSFLLSLALFVSNLLMLADRPTKSAAGLQPLDDRSAILPPIRAGSLALYPIVALDPRPEDDVLALDEAMQARLVRVTEVEPARVDGLYFANAADRPVFVLAGEVIVGGNQDRVVATTAVIPPHSSQVVPVRCVEHGRWSGSTGDFTTAYRLAHDRLRGTAAYAEQTDVWHEVARANNAHFTTNPTDSYRDLADLQPLYARQLEERVVHGLAWIPIADRRRMIGYTVAYNGQVAAVDTFRSPVLFAKLERKLLHAYLADAADLPDDGSAPPDVAAVRVFIDDAKRGAAERAFSTEASRTFVQRGSLASTSQVELGDRHLYANYLGNHRITRTAPAAPSEPGTWTCDRHLYPGYLGNARLNEECRRPRADNFE